MWIYSSVVGVLGLISEISVSPAILLSHSAAKSDIQFVNSHKNSKRNFLFKDFFILNVKADKFPVPSRFAELHTTSL